MSTASASQAEAEVQTSIVNDFSIHIATANGTGSQTANMVLMRGLFRMGIPVSGKNMFPSNIQGLPTWFTVRANKDGWIARKEDPEVVIMMNPETARSDVEEAAKGAVLIYEETLKLSEMRPDCIHYAVPFKKLVVEFCPDIRLRKLVVNMLYVGVAAQLFGIHLDSLERAMNTQLAGKQRAIDLNMPALQGAMKWAEENLTKRDPYRVEPMEATKGKIVIEGNQATALGAMFAGVTVVAWYPITPSSSCCEALESVMNKYRVEEDGKKTFAVIQAEDEIAAVGILAGAGWAGARCFTSTSGPGISLMSEIIGLAYFAEIPMTIVNVARTGPSTGMPTRTMQGDLMSLAYCSHGDTKHFIIIPSNPKEAFELTQVALNFAEEFQAPVFVLTDLDLGMNFWLSDRFEYPTEPIRRGKILTKERLEELKGDWGRYRDVDGDAVTWRTLPGTDHEKAAYFTRGTSHTAEATYTEKGSDWVEIMDRIAKKYENGTKLLPKPEIIGTGQPIGLLYYGTTEMAIKEAEHILKSKHGVDVDLCRVRSFPFCQEVEDFLDSHERTYVIENNRDGQMALLIKAELPKFATKVRNILHYDGLPLAAMIVVEQFLRHEGLAEG